MLTAELKHGIAQMKTDKGDIDDILSIWWQGGGARMLAQE